MSLGHGRQLRPDQRCNFELFGCEFVRVGGQIGEVTLRQGVVREAVKIGGGLIGIEDGAGHRIGDQLHGRSLAERSVAASLHPPAEN